MTKVHFPLLLFLFLFYHSHPAQGGDVYSIVAGSGSSFEAVESITVKVISAGFEAKTLDFSTPQKSLFRACSGFFTSQQEAIKNKTNLITRTGIRDAWVIKITPEFAGLFPQPESQANNSAEKNPQETKTAPETINNEQDPKANEPSKKTYDQQNPENLKNSDLDEVIRIYKEIITSIATNNISKIEKYVDPESGIIEIIDPEGIPYPIYSSNLKQAVIQGLFISNNNGDPVKDYLPEFDCNLGIWSKSGTYISGVKNYSRLTNILKEAEEVVYIDKILLNAIENIEYRISVVVLSTDESLLGFYKKGGSWFIGVVDNSFDCVE